MTSASEAHLEVAQEIATEPEIVIQKIWTQTLECHLGKWLWDLVGVGTMAVCAVQSWSLAFVP